LVLIVNKIRGKRDKCLAILQSSIIALLDNTFLFMLIEIEKVNKLKDVYKGHGEGDTRWKG
jgi:hypothetical protein